MHYHYHCHCYCYCYCEHECASECGSGWVRTPAALAALGTRPAAQPHPPHCTPHCTTHCPCAGSGEWGGGACGGVGARAVFSLSPRPAPAPTRPAAGAAPLPHSHTHSHTHCHSVPHLSRCHSFALAVWQAGSTPSLPHSLTLTFKSNVSGVVGAWRA
jgi:hypothetical protein